MSIYIKKFENHTHYENYINSSKVILPNVSLCENESNVHFNPYDPYNGHKYVEIGGVKWATMNVGANKISDYGYYFSWGDTQGYTLDQIGSNEGQKYFGWQDYKYFNGNKDINNDDVTESNMIKYNLTDNKILLDKNDDPVSVNWGGKWRLPTLEEYGKLVENVNVNWTTYEDIQGIECIDKIDSSKILFFPAAKAYGEGKTEPISFIYYWLNNCVDDINADKNRFITSYVFYYMHGVYNDISLGISYRSVGVPARGVIG